MTQIKKKLIFEIPKSGRSSHFKCHPLECWDRWGWQACFRHQSRVSSFESFSSPRDGLFKVGQGQEKGTWESSSSLFISERISKAFTGVFKNSSLTTCISSFSVFFFFPLSTSCLFPLSWSCLLQNTCPSGYPSALRGSFSSSQAQTGSPGL